MKRIVLAILLLCHPTSLLADIELAIKAYEHGDYLTAYHEFIPLAESGNALAQYNLAFLYYEGYGIEQNLEKAVIWFNRSALAGYAPAQDTLAYLYNHGLGLPYDPLRAYVWYSIAADNGIFLAETIKNKLGKKLNQTQLVQAEIMIRHYQSNHKVPD